MGAVADDGFRPGRAPAAPRRLGIVVATVVLRWVMARVYVVLLRRVVPAPIVQELAEERPANRT